MPDNVQITERHAVLDSKGAQLLNDLIRTIVGVVKKLLVAESDDRAIYTDV